MLKQLLKMVGLTNSGAAPTPVVTEPSAPLQPIIDVTDATFAEIVLGANQLVVVDFWAEWCQPCQIMSAYVGFLAKDFAGQLVLTAVDVDENPLTPEQYTIMGLPTLLFFRDGQEVDRIVGVEPYEIIRERVAVHLTDK